MRFRRTVNLMVVVVALAGMAGLVELCSAIAMSKLPVYESRWAFREQRPPAYSESPYFSADFIHESARSVAITFDGKVVRLRDFKGKYINVVGGHRRTAFVPEDARNTVHMYGASTLLSQEVPDEYTIPSILQREVNKITHRYRFVNYGVPAMNSEQQFYYLRETNLKQGDIVIFYDGGTDIYHNVYAGRKHGFDGTSVAEKPGILESRILPALKKVGMMNFSALLEYVKQKSPPPNMRDEEEVRGRAVAASKNFGRNIEMANEYSMAHGAKFYHFRDPNLFLTKLRTKHKQFLLDNFLLTPPGLEKASDESADRFAAVCDELNSKGIVSVDLSGALDNMRGEVFLDFCHTTERANEAVAKAIFSKVAWVP